MDPPPTKFLDRDGSDLAYQTYGSGPINLVLHLEAVNHLDLSWTDPHIHRNLARFGKRARCVVFNRRGFGLSDPLTYVPTLEQQADDVLTVMDACGMDRAVLFGTFTTCGAVAMVAGAGAACGFVVGTGAAGAFCAWVTETGADAGLATTSCRFSRPFALMITRA